MELGLGDALRPTAVETDERCLDRSVIDLTSGTEGVSGERTKTPYKNNSGEVQERRDVVLPLRESMDKGPSLSDYDPYDDGFELFLEYGKGYGNRTAFKNAFYK